MIIAGNWKMNMDRQSAAALVADISSWRQHAENPETVIVFPPAILMDIAASSRGDGILLGGQDCHANASGAHTGDVSAAMLRDAGCDWVLVGHSERRIDYHETSEMVSAKADAALNAGLTPIICVGEQWADRDAGRAFDVVAEQIKASLPQESTGNFVIAYEPVWAIGTGQVAGPDDVDAMHNYIRELLVSINPAFQDVAILYGGSVKPDNAAALLALDNVGGALVGGASLKSEDFIAIAEAV